MSDVEMHLVSDDEMCYKICLFPLITNILHRCTLTTQPWPRL